jgi:catechol 2,3-dioxygenase-like lactoylglutathione lyase family enzyme
MEALVSRMLEHYESGRISRRHLIQALAAAAVGTRAVAAPAPESTFQGVEVNHVALRVTDVERSRDFYQKHLGLPVVRQSSSSCFLGLGKNFLALFGGSQPRMDHYCIAVKSYEVKQVTQELERQGLNPDQPAGSSRVYFRDPDGLVVQLSAVDHQP